MKSVVHKSAKDAHAMKPHALCRAIQNIVLSDNWNEVTCKWCLRVLKVKKHNLSPPKAEQRN